MLNLTTVLYLGSKFCNYFWSQALLRKAKTLGVVREIEGNLEGRLLLKKYYALALLPAPLVTQAFNDLWVI